MNNWGLLSEHRWFYPYPSPILNVWVISVQGSPGRRILRRGENDCRDSRSLPRDSPLNPRKWRTLTVIVRIGFSFECVKSKNELKWNLDDVEGRWAFLNNSKHVAFRNCKWFPSVKSKSRVKTMERIYEEKYRARINMVSLPFQRLTNLRNMRLSKSTVVIKNPN